MNTVYANAVIASQAKDLLETKLNTRSLMTIDNELTDNAGMKKTINTYVYSGVAESLDVGEGNTAETRGSIAYTGKDYTVALLQQAYDYFDEDVMKDPQIVGMMMDGAVQVMVNKLNADFFTAIATTSTTHSIEGALSYDGIVDAIATLNLEDESGLFLLINPAEKAMLRKDDDYVAARMGDVVYNGQVGTICGIPVIVSKSVPEDTAFIATKEAVTLFIKKETEVEQERDADHRKNSVYLRNCYIVALTDATKACKIVLTSAAEDEDEDEEELDP